jgi:ribonuclease HI
LQIISIYSDGSCHTQQKIGGWAAIVFLNNDKTILSGCEFETTHNRMEILAVINAIEFVKKSCSVNDLPTTQINIISDSQYVIGLIDRAEKLIAKNFITKKGKILNNTDLIEQFLLAIASVPHISFTKIKAHQQLSNSTMFNIEVDKICRNIVRQNVV